eukprot:COSAG02_NODE_1523_length_12140_cov_16.419650_1_plen_60_part_00
MNRDAAQLGSGIEGPTAATANNAVGPCSGEVSRGLAKAPIGRECDGLETDVEVVLIACK